MQNDTRAPQSELEEGKRSDASNMMFVVVRNLKSQSNSNAEDYELQKGDTLKVGRLKFAIKDFRTAVQPANADLKRADTDKNISPIRKCNYSPIDEDSENDFQEEEAVEIDCGVVDPTKEGEEAIQCKVCWSNEQTPDNPLLNSCKCDGSVRFIHY